MKATFYPSVISQVLSRPGVSVEFDPGYIHVVSCSVPQLLHGGHVAVGMPDSIKSFPLVLRRVWLDNYRSG